MKKIGLGLLFSIAILTLIATLSFSSIPTVSAQASAILTAVRATTVSTDPLDGSWSSIPALTVDLSAEGEKPIVLSGVVYEPAKQVALQAAYTTDTLFIRAVWSDATQNDNRSFWTYTANGWVKSPMSEDRLAFMFDITGNRQFNTLGCSAACHTATADTPAYMGFPPDSKEALDLWYWKAARTVGYADDQWAGALVKGAEPTGRANDAKKSGGYVDNVNKAGNAPRLTYAAGVNPLGPLFANKSLEITDTMKFENGQTIPFYVQERFVGSRGDVNVSARYVRAENGAGQWYVVLSRALNTGNPDDSVFAPNSKNTFGVAVFNNAGGSNHAASKSKLVLELGK